MSFQKGRHRWAGGTRTNAEEDPVAPEDADVCIGTERRCPEPPAWPVCRYVPAAKKAGGVFSPWGQRLIGSPLLTS
jgi:hypothetical protein